MKTWLFLILILTFFPINLLAQYKRETGFTLGVILPDHSLDHSIDAKLGPSIKFGFNQSWYKPDQKSTFRPEFGINLERIAIDNIGYGGLGGGASYKGSIWSMNAEVAALAQFQINKGMFFAIGPAGKYLIANYENLISSWWLMYHSGGVEETSEFSRKYFLKPAFGIKAIFMETNLCKKIQVGLSFEYLWRNYKEYRYVNSYDEIFQYSQTSEISLYLGLR